MKAIDFFCGAGGLTKGLQQAGIDVVAGIDINEHCKDTYNKNNSPSRFVCSDIRAFNLDDLRSLNSDLFQDPKNVLFAGCAPCQSFSQQRKSKKTRPDKSILIQFGRLVSEFLPGYVLVENVPGIAKIKGGSAFNRFLKMLSRNDYDYEWHVVNAKHYGVPQNRRRLILIASRNNKVSFPLETHGKGLLPYITVRETIEHLPPISPGESHKDIPNHYASEITPINIERLQHTPHNGGDRRSWPYHLVLECHKNGYQGHTDTYGRMFWDRPAPTLTSKCHSISNGRYGHPEQERAISLREAASLQTFPIDYTFYGLLMNVALQIGNAVPVQLGRVFGEHILDIYNKDISNDIAA